MKKKKTYEETRSEMIDLLGPENWNYLMEEASREEFNYAVSTWPEIVISRNGKKKKYDVRKIVGGVKL